MDLNLSSLRVLRLATRSKRRASISFSACFFGLYLAYFALTKLAPVIEIKEDKDLVFKIVAYSSMPIYLLGFVTALVPETFFLSFDRCQSLSFSSNSAD